MNASTDVTVALRRTHSLLQSELSRSQFATETLNSSTAALHDLSTRYTAFDDIVSSSRELITDLIRKNKSDRWYYEKAIQLLIGTLIWILVRRLVWGPVWLLVGVPFKLVWWTLSLVAWGMGVGGDLSDVETYKSADRADGIMGGKATVEVKGIPESMLERVPEVRATQSVVAEEPRPIVMEESMKEKVERIIDGEENVVMVEEQEQEERNPKSRQLENDSVEEQTIRQEERNPKSRRMEYYPAEEQVVQEEARNPKSRRMEYDPAEETSVLEEPAAEVTTDAREAVEENVHDEL